MKWMSILWVLLFPPLAFAGGVEDEFSYAADTLWVLIAAMFVFFMQAGFAMYEMGMHSSKNTINVLMKNCLDFVMAAIMFWIVGFAFMFGDGNGIIGLEGFFLSGTYSSLDWANVPLEAKFFFQLAFAGTTATIISGAIGGRVKFNTYLALSKITIAFIYPILGHWVWGGGWLAMQGFFDFAGSTVVHGVGGFAALAAAIVVGPRIGRFSEDGKPIDMPPHNLSMVGFGVLILWLGWFGFNPGSTMAIVGSTHLVAHIFLTTCMSAAAGCVTAMSLSWASRKHPDGLTTLNGILAGLVSITAPCAYVTIPAALLIGTIGGCVYYFGEKILNRFCIDDAVGAFPVHGLCGVWGTIAVGLFSAAPWGGGEGPRLGLFYGGGFSQLIIQTYGTLIVCMCSFVMTYVAALFLKGLMGIRVSKEEELAGLDISEHGQNAYNHSSFLNQ